MIKKIKKLIILLVVVVFVFGLYGVYKPLPIGINYASPIYPATDSGVTFLADRTYLDKNGQQQFEHEIFDTITKLIENARGYVLLDFFLFNDQKGQATEVHRSLSSDLAKALVNYKNNNTISTIKVITDPINYVYGSYTPTPLSLLNEAGVPVTVTNLTVLRDSNFLYSAWWRSGLRLIPNIGGHILPNPFDPNHSKATLSAYLRLLNFKANHRKVLVTYDGPSQTWQTLVASFNPHDGSSRHSNVALLLTDVLAKEVIFTEQAVLNFSQSNDHGVDISPVSTTDYQGPADTDVFVQLLTEQAIKKYVLSQINKLGEGDNLDMAMFYIADREIVKALKNADNKGVKIRLLFDPNKDAFGREKNGIPNRQVAHELVKNSSGQTEIKWCATFGEQCHSKMLITRQGDKYELLLGSANFTRRNLGNYNLETDIRVIGTSQTTAIKEATAFFDEQWFNKFDRAYSLPYEKFAEDSLFKTVWYRFGEFTGLSHY